MSRKNLDFGENGSQRIAESSLGVNEDLNKQAKNAGNGVFTTRFASAEGKSSVLIALHPRRPRGG